MEFSVFVVLFSDNEVRGTSAAFRKYRVFAQGQSAGGRTPAQTGRKHGAYSIPFTRENMPDSVSFRCFLSDSSRCAPDCLFSSKPRFSARGLRHGCGARRITGKLLLSEVLPMDFSRMQRKTLKRQQGRYSKTTMKTAACPSFPDGSRSQRSVWQTVCEDGSRKRADAATTFRLAEQKSRQS